MTSTMRCLATMALVCACAGEEPDIDSVDQGLISMNSYSWNSLSADWNDVKSVLGDRLMQSPATGRLSKETLTYLARCALPASSSVTIQNSSTGVSITYPGKLGVAPSWPLRAPTDIDAECVVSCVEAHMNALGMAVPISVRGLKCRLPVTAADGPYGFQEGAFFGDRKLAPRYFCVGPDQLKACPVTYDKAMRDSRCVAADAHCNLTYAGLCSKACRAFVNGQWEGCSAGGRTFDASTTVNLLQQEFPCD